MDQRAYLLAKMDRIGNLRDLVNRIIEVDPDTGNSGQVVLRIFDLPKNGTW